MKALFFKTIDGELINLAEFVKIYGRSDNASTVLERGAFDYEILYQPIEDIEAFLLKVQGVL